MAIEELKINFNCKNEMKTLKDVELIYLDREPTLYIGSSFKSDIFYQYRQKIKEKHGVLFFEMHDLYYMDLSKEYDLSDGNTDWPENEEFVTNGRANLSGKKRRLLYGDEVIIFGMKIMYLGRFVMIKSNEGDMRIASRERRR